MSNKILHKRNLTTGIVPTTSSLSVGELAINVADGKVYLRKSGSIEDTILPLVTANTITTGSITATSFTGSLFGTSSWAQNAITASHATSVGPLNQNLIVTGSLTILGTASFIYTTASQLDIGTNLISVNTNAATRFGGLAVIDSGSSPRSSGSLLFDSQNNQWIFVHQNLGGAITSSVLIMGPQTFNNVGNEATVTANRLTKGTGGDLGEHIGDSNITDTGTLVSVNSNTQITGSLIISSGITGSLQGTASFALTASYLDNYIPPFPFTGSALITGSLQVTGSLSVSGVGEIKKIRDNYNSTGSTGQLFTSDGSNTKWVSFKDTIQLQINSEGPTVVSGSKAFRYTDDELFIEKITITSKYTGSIEFILKDATTTYGSSSLTNNVLYTDTTLSNWTRTIPSASLLEFIVGPAGGFSSGSASTFLFLINTIRKPV